MPAFMPKYSWTPAELLFQTLKYFKPYRTMRNGLFIAKFLNLHTEQHDDRFIELQEAMPFSERICSTLAVSAKPVLDGSQYRKVEGFSNLYQLRQVEHMYRGRPSTEFDYFLYLPAGEAKEERFIFEIEHGQLLFAIRKEGSNNMYQCIGIAHRCDTLEEPQFFAAYFERISEYLPVITISHDKAPCSWPQGTAAVDMPFLCFFHLLKQRVFPRNEL